MPAALIVMAMTLITGMLLQRDGPAGPPLRWSKGQGIHVWIDPANAPAAAGALVERAMKTWTEAAAGRFVLVKTAVKDAAALRVHFVRGNSAYGETFPRVDGRTGSITEADVAIAADAPALDPLVMFFGNQMF